MFPAFLLEDKLKNLLLILILVACSSPNPTPSPPPTPSTSPSAMACLPTDQDNDIYHPDRLKVMQSCIQITGTVLAKIQEADGDFHIRVLLDSQFSSLLTTSNQLQCANQNGTRICGLMVVEPVCVNPVSQPDAVATCAADTDPLTVLPSIGQHVWMDGRYVIDLDHHDSTSPGWAELHPLYRWGVQ